MFIAAVREAGDAYKSSNELLLEQEFRDVGSHVLPVRWEVVPAVVRFKFVFPTCLFALNTQMEAKGLSGSPVPWIKTSRAGPFSLLIPGLASRSPWGPPGDNAMTPRYKSGCSAVSKMACRAP